MTRDEYRTEDFAMNARFERVAETLRRLRATRNRLLAEHAEREEVITRLVRINEELRDMCGNAVATRATALVALESINIASKQRGDMATARVAGEALASVYGRVR